MEPKSIRDLRAKLAARGITLEEYAERWRAYCKANSKDSGVGNVDIWPGWRSSPRYEKTWMRICKDPKRKDAYDAGAKVIPFKRK